MSKNKNKNKEQKKTGSHLIAKFSSKWPKGLTITNIYRALKVNIGEYPVAAGKGMLS